MFTLYDPVCKLENYRKSIMALLLAPYPFPRTLTSTNVPVISYLSNGVSVNRRFSLQTKHLRIYLCNLLCNNTYIERITFIYLDHSLLDFLLVTIDVGSTKYLIIHVVGPLQG
jgi:hypothetical protein